MVQEVRIPFSALNNVLPTSQFEDVEFQVPEVADLVDGVETALPTRQDIREVIQQELRDLERDVPDLQVPVDEIGEAVAREVGDLADEVVNIEISGLFGPTERDIEQAFEELFDVGERLDPDLIPSIAEVQQAVTDGIEDALRGTLGVDPNRLGDLLEDLLGIQEDILLFFTDPTRFTQQALEESDMLPTADDVRGFVLDLAGEVGGRVRDQLISEDVQDEFGRSVDSFRQALDELEDDGSP